LGGKAREKFPRLTDRLVNALLLKIENRAILIKNIPEEFHYERDPKDVPYLNLALVANASYLVSQDKDLLDLMTTSSDAALRFRFRYPFLRILKAADFVREIDRGRGRDPSP
jgi:predicted nucleic acid-binding protein